MVGISKNITTASKPWAPTASVTAFKPLRTRASSTCWSAETLQALPDQ